MKVNRLKKYFSVFFCSDDFLLEYSTLLLTVGQRLQPRLCVRQDL